MVKEQLIINGVDVPLEGSLNPNLTYSIQDVEEPDKRKSTFSKTITLPASKELNELFNFIFEINIEGTFNPNLKADAIYLVDSEIQLEGFLKLNAINYLDNSDITYDVTIFGTLANFITDLGELELTDIQNLDDFNHPYNAVEAVNSWDTTINYLGVPTAFQYGFGYVYPLIDYGADNTLESWGVRDMYPAFYVKELWDRIFEDAGYTYSSTFLSSSGTKEFKQAIIPFNGDKFGLSAAQIANRTFEADTPTFLSTMTGITNQDNSYVGFTDVSDAGGVHNNGTFTAPATGRYNLNFNIDLAATFYPDPTAPVATKPNTTLRVVLRAMVNGVVKNSKVVYITPDLTAFVFPAGSTTTSSNPTYPDNEYASNVTAVSGGACGDPVTINPRNYEPPNTAFLSLNDYPLYSGDTVRLQVIAYQEKINSGCGGLWYNSGAGTTFDGTVDLTIVNTGDYKGIAVNSEYFEGDTIDMYGALPRKIKQRDFVMSIVNMFNLYIEPDKDNPRQLNIEPRDDFYSTVTNDWSEKLDVSQDLIFEPMGLLDAGRYIFTYKQDKDYYNEKYQASYDDIYGQREVIIDNDFIKNDKTSKIIFSPTPLVGQSSNDRVISTIKKVDQSFQSVRTSSNIRYLIYDGLKDTASTWTYDGTVYTQYPYVGHFDDPFNPTVDVNFGLPYEIYYDNTYAPITVTDNNLYNAHHKKRIDEITDPDSKLVKGRFYVTPRDIAKLSFKEQYFFNNAYHRLLKVNNYNPTATNLTECWFLKLKIANQYNPTTSVINGAIDNPISSDEDTPVMALYVSNPSDGNSYNTFTTEVKGRDNYVDRSAYAIDINGDDNNVSADTKNITIQGDRNFIQGGLENIVLINTNDTTVTESNVTYINGQKQAGGSGDSIYEVASTGTGDKWTVVLSYLGVEVDTTVADFTVNLPTAIGNEGLEFTIKKISNDGNPLKVGAQTGQTLDDIPNGQYKIITNYNTTMVVYSNGANWKIK